MDEKKIDEKKIVELSIDDILPNRFQPRIKFDDSAIFELSESIKVHGVFQPIIVRPIGDKYEIIAGERRYKASVLAGKQTIPAIIMNINDSDTIEIALIENVQRANLTPIEEAVSYKKILDMGYINQESLAQKLGKTQSTIANKLRLLNLADEVQEALLENKISERHARSLLKLKDFQDQRNLLEKIISERLTVRKTDEEIDKMLNNEQNTNPFNNLLNVQTEESQVTNPFNNAINAIPVEASASPVSDTAPVALDNIGNYASQAPSTPIVPDKPIYNIGDVNNQVFNPTSYDTGVINSTVISSNALNTEFNPDRISTIDLNNLEQNAQDLNSARPVAPMQDFLMTNNQNSLESTSSTSDEDDGDLLKPGKFFSFPVEPEVKPQTIDYNESKNFNFDNLYNNQMYTPVDNNSPLVGNVNDVYNEKVNPVGDFNSFQSNNSEDVEPVNNNYVEPVFDTSSTAPSFSNFSFTPVENPNVENVEVQSNNDSIGSKFSNINFDPSSDSFPSINSEVSQFPGIVTPTINDDRYQEAVNMLKNAIKTIEDKGYVVQVNESNNPDKYTFTIDIKK